MVRGLTREEWNSLCWWILICMLGSHFLNHFLNHFLGHTTKFSTKFSTCSVVDSGGRRGRRCAHHVSSASAALPPLAIIAAEFVPVLLASPSLRHRQPAPVNRQVWQDGGSSVGG
jgi:hypothetical protein